MLNISNQQETGFTLSINRTLCITNGYEDSTVNCLQFLADTYTVLKQSFKIFFGLRDRFPSLP